MKTTSHFLICLIISADYTANENYNIKKTTTTITLDQEKITERTKLKNYLINMANKNANSLSNQFKHLVNIINLWETLQITSQQFIAIILMTKQLGDYAQASTWCINGNGYFVEPDPNESGIDFITSEQQAILHITGDKLCMASFAK